MSENRSNDGTKCMEMTEAERQLKPADVLRAWITCVGPSAVAAQKNEGKVAFVDFSKESSTKHSQPPARVNVEYETLKQHWKEAFRAFDRMVKSRQTTIEQPIGDEVEKLRTDLEKRMKQEYGVKLVPPLRIGM